MNEGFSLFETCMVLALLVYIISISFNIATYYERFFLKAELNKLSLFFLKCSQKATIQNQIFKIFFNETDHTFSDNEQTYSLLRGVYFGLQPGIKGPPSHPIKEPTSGVHFLHKQIMFHPDGKIQAGTIYLTDIKKRWTYALSCAVGHISYLRRYQYQKGSWILIP